MEAAKQVMRVFFREAALFSLAPPEGTNDNYITNRLSAKRENTLKTTAGSL